MVSERIGAAIVKGKRLLLVSANGTDWYWTPGGKRRANESREACLRRELREELGISVKSYKEYLSYERFDPKMRKRKKVYWYLVEYKGKLRPCQEIHKLLWFSRKNFETHHTLVVSSVTEKLIPKLIEEKIL